MPTVLYIRGVPGTGKRTVSDLLERDLKWPVLWVHLLDPIYKCIREYKVPTLTDDIMLRVARQLLEWEENFMVVRPTRSASTLYDMAKLVKYRSSHSFIPVRLTADYKTLCTRVTRRWHDSPYRLTTKEALDEYLGARPESEFPGEYVIDTTNLTPEQVASKIKELLPQPEPWYVTGQVADANEDENGDMCQ